MNSRITITGFIYFRRKQKWKMHAFDGSTGFDVMKHARRGPDKDKRYRWHNDYAFLRIRRPRVYT